MVPSKSILILFLMLASVRAHAEPPHPLAPVRCLISLGKVVVGRAVRGITTPFKIRLITPHEIKNLDKGDYEAARDKYEAILMESRELGEDAPKTLKEKLGFLQAFITVNLKGPAAVDEILDAPSKLINTCLWISPTGWISAKGSVPNSYPE